MARLVIKLPDVGEGTVEAELVSWLVSVGQEVTEDQNLAEVTTDKATVEIPSPAGGKVLALHGAPGEMLAVGSNIVELETNSPISESQSQIDNSGAAGPLVSRTVHVQKYEMGLRILASPAVRARALGLGITLENVVGTGPGARITHKDLDTFLTYEQRSISGSEKPATVHGQNPAENAIREIRIIGVRRKIAERMQESKRHIPHYSYIEEVDVTALEELRKEIGDQPSDHGSKLSILPFVVAAVAKAVPSFPQVNSHFDDTDSIVRQFSSVHAGIATQTDRGLMVPVVLNAERHDLWSLARAIYEAAESARTGKAERESLTGSTITVTSLGRLGGVATTPVINRPEVAIVGVNKAIQRPAVHAGQLTIRTFMNLSSSFDHRIVDGWIAASFIQKVKAYLEQPATLFLPNKPRDLSR